MPDIEPSSLQQSSTDTPSGSGGSSSGSGSSSSSEPKSSASDALGKASSGTGAVQNNFSEKDENNGAKDADAAARNTLSIVKTGFDAAKTVVQASEGDIIGAMKTVTSNPTLRLGAGTAFIRVFLSSSLAAIVLYLAFPLALYEGTQTYSETFHEAYLTEYYSSDDNRAFAAIRATVIGLDAVWDDVWDNIKSNQTKNADGTTDLDGYTEDDLLLMGDGDALTSVYERKIEAIQDKLSTRSDAIIDALEASAGGSTDSLNNLNGAAYRYRYLADKEEMEELSDTRNVSYGGLEIVSAVQSLSKKDAIKILALYSTQYSLSPSTVEPYALMKWLGYYAASAEKVSFLAGDCVWVSVEGWEGEFMPQYLVEEQEQNPDGDYSSYQCPAADILLEVDTQPILDITKTIERTPVITSYTTEVKTWTWKWMQTSTYQSLYMSKISSSYTAPTTSKPEKKYNLKNWDWYWVETTKQETVTEIEYDYTISYTMAATVCLRSVDTITDLVGFYEEELTIAE